MALTFFVFAHVDAREQYILEINICHFICNKSYNCLVGKGEQGEDEKVGGTYLRGVSNNLVSCFKKLASIKMRDFVIAVCEESNLQVV